MLRQPLPPVLLTILISICIMKDITYAQDSPGPQAGKIEGMISVPGGRVWYRIVGAEKKGIPLITVHGGPGAPHDYLESLEDLADVRPVVFYDQLGCGNSDHPTDTSLWTVSRFVDELEQLRQALNIGEFHLLGTSWGTMLSVEYYLHQKPEELKSMILSGPYLNTKRWCEDQQKWISRLPANIRDTIKACEASKQYESPSYLEAMMQFYNRHLCRLDPWPECLNITMEKLGVQVYHYMWGPSEFTMTGTLRDADVTSRLENIHVPVLLTCGEYDESTPETTLFYSKLIPGSEVHIFKDASHTHHLESRKEYMLIVQDFLNKRDTERNVRR